MRKLFNLFAMLTLLSLSLLTTSCDKDKIEGVWKFTDDGNRTTYMYIKPEGEGILISINSGRVDSTEHFTWKRVDNRFIVADSEGNRAKSPESPEIVEITSNTMTFMSPDGEHIITLTRSPLSEIERYLD